MSARKPTTRSKATGRYHHGELRAALLASALEMIDEEGPSAVSTRSLARKLGVSHAAPARHFRDRTSLLAEVAAEAFEAFARALEASAQGVAEPREALAAMGRAYVRFAMRHPGQMRLMFGDELTFGESRSEHLQEASARAYRILEDCVRPVLGALASQGDVNAAAFAAWSQVHGAASLWLNGPLRGFLPKRGPQAAFLQLADAAVEAVSRAIAAS